MVIPGRMAEVVQGNGADIALAAVATKEMSHG